MRSSFTNMHIPLTSSLVIRKSFKNFSSLNISAGFACFSWTFCPILKSNLEQNKAPPSYPLLVTNICDLARDNDNFEVVHIFLRDSNESSIQLYDSDEHRIPN